MMEMGDGMVAVVRGLPDAALAVTLVEGSRQYTLVPNSAVNNFLQNTGGNHIPPKPGYVHMQGAPLQYRPAPHEPHLQQPPLQHPPLQHQLPLHHQPSLQHQPPLHHQPLYEQPALHHQPQPALQYHPGRQQACTDPPDLKHYHHDTSSQAVDGRYASVYKTAHCRVQPTSPPVELTEFPPQRAELCRVRGNFEVGGLGCLGGKDTSPTRAHGHCRGALTWPDREPDAFASSLRKYPAMSPDRSSEMVERLIYYSQNKNVSPSRQQGGGRGQSSPQRPESHSSGQLFDRRSSIAASLRCQRNDPDNYCKYKGGSSEQSPREGSRRQESADQEYRRPYSRSYDVRLLRDVSRRARDIALHPCSYTQPAYPHVKKFDLPSSDKPGLNTVNAVNTETQAEIMMVSREAATEPLEKISKRNVAVPASSNASVSLSPAPRRMWERDRCSQAVQTPQQLEIALTAIKTCSSVYIPCDRSDLTARRSRSLELIKQDHKDSLLLINKQLDKYARKNNTEAMSLLFSDLLNVKKKEAVYFVNSIVYNLRDVFNKPMSPLRDLGRRRMMLIAKPVQNSSMQTVHDCNQSYITQATDEENLEDPEKDLDRYNEQLVREINVWMESISELRDVDMKTREVVATQLAGDIIDRHKYLQLHPGSGGSHLSELEHLKYQIYRRMNKLLEDNFNTVTQAARLLNKLKSIPVPRACSSVGTDPHCCDYVDMEEYHRGSEVIPPIESIVMPAFVNQKRRKSSPVVISGCCVPKPSDGQPPSTSVQEELPCSADDRSNSRQEATGLERGAACCGQANPPGLPGEMSNRRRTASDSTPPPQVKDARGRRVSLPPHLQMTVERPRQNPSPGPAHTNIEQKRTSTGTSSAPGGCCSGRDTAVDSPSTPTDQFDEFLKNWVRQIPIHTSDPAEIALLDKMRLGIYVGVWKAVAKLQMNPTARTNPFYYQDLLEDELDELLDLLPDSCELTGARPRLKAQLVEHTTAARKQLVTNDSSASYRQRLVDNVVQNIPRRTVDRSDYVDRLVEQVHRLRLADDFILYVANRDRDRLRASVYKNKLEKDVQQLIEDIKGTTDGHNAPHRDDIMKALHHVPVPSEQIVREEAAQVLLGAEIEQWLADLPLPPPADHVDALARRRHRNVLTKKLHDLQRRAGLNSCEPQLRQEIYKFIEKLPLNSENNVDFMVDELVNRLRNRPADAQARGSIAEPGSFHDFSRDLPLCSSYSEGHAPESYMIVGGERVSSLTSGHVQQRQDLTPESQQQWYTLEETSLPPVEQPKQGGACCSERRASVAIQTPATVNFRERAEGAAPRPPEYRTTAPPSSSRRESDTRGYERRQASVATSSPSCGQTNRPTSQGIGQSATGQSSTGCKNTACSTEDPSTEDSPNQKPISSARVQTSASLLQDEVVCRCTERVWRRSRPPLCRACDDLDDYPPCFPVRYACPYYF